MSYPALMVYVDANAPSEQLVRVAVNLADKLSSKLIGVSALAVRPPFVAEGVVIEEITEAQIAAMKSKLLDRERWFHDIAGAQSLKPHWRSALDFPLDALAREARAADLIIVAQRRKVGDVYDSLDPGGAILRIGRPLLVVPEGVDAFRADHIVVGWKDTREAHRAVQDALPFLHEAKRVTLVEICRSGDEGQGRDRIADVAQYLGCHRIKADTRIFIHEKSDAVHLIEFAQDEEADLLVTGAYGHSRLGEWVFGGVTRELLASSPICCLMSH
jgi:nucleotide-binding universal stress UspA family protein